MSDLFLKDVPDDYILKVVEVMLEASWHKYQVLTKRSERMRDLLNSKLMLAATAPHILWGVSVEDRKSGLPRVGHLQQAKATMRFVSFEPLLEDVGEVNLNGIDWVIVGGESGHGARSFHLEWARSILRQCKQQNVASFIKQFGLRPVQDGNPLRLASRKGGDWNEWPEDLRVRQLPVKHRQRGEED
jgi:protein gp37